MAKKIVFVVYSQVGSGYKFSLSLWIQLYLDFFDRHRRCCRYCYRPMDDWLIDIYLTGP